MLRLRYPQDFRVGLKQVVEGGKATEVLLQHVSVDLSSNYDLRASVDFEFDQAYFTLGFTESVQDEGGEWQTEVSHEQSPLIFKRNNDHYKTVRRELVAEDVESAERTRRHTLTLTSRSWMRSPAGSPLLEQNKASETESCLYVGVKIHVKAASHSAQSLY